MPSVGGVPVFSAGTCPYGGRAGWIGVGTLVPFGISVPSSRLSRGSIPGAVGLGNSLGAVPLGGSGVVNSATGAVGAGTFSLIAVTDTPHVVSLSSQSLPRGVAAKSSNLSS